MGFFRMESPMEHASTPAWSSVLRLQRTGQILDCLLDRKDWELIHDKEVVLVLGDAEVGKTRIVQALVGETLERSPDGRIYLGGNGAIRTGDSSPVVDADPHRTVGVVAFQQDALTYVDTGSVLDKRGHPEEEIVNAICLFHTWQRASAIKPVYVISWEQFHDHSLGPLLQGYAEMLEMNEQAIENTTFIINHLPHPFHNHQKEHVVNYFRSLTEEVDTTIGHGACRVARVISDQLNRGDVIWFDPTSKLSVSECIRRLNRANPIMHGEVEGLSQLSMVPGFLDTQLQEIRTHIRPCIEEEDGLTHLIGCIHSLRLLAHSVPAAHVAWQEVRNLLSKEMIRSQQEVIAILARVPDEATWPNHYGEIDQVLAELRRASASVEVQIWLSRDYLTRRQLESAVAKAWDGLVKASAGQTDYCKIGQIHRKLRVCMDNIKFYHGKDFPGAVVQVMRDKIATILCLLSAFNIPEWHTSEEEIQDDFNKFFELHQQLKHAHAHLGHMVSEDVTVELAAHREHSLSMFTEQLHDVMEIFCRWIPMTQMRHEDHLKRLYCILRVAGSHNSRTLVNGDAWHSLLKQAQERAIAQASELLQKLQLNSCDVNAHQLAPIQILRRIDPIFDWELDLPLLLLFRRACKDFGEKMECYQAKLAESAVDKPSLQRLHTQLYHSVLVWRDLFPDKMLHLGKTLRQVEELAFRSEIWLDHSMELTELGVDVFRNSSFFSNTFNPNDSTEYEHSLELIDYILRHPGTNLIQVTRTQHYQELLQINPGWAGLLNAEIIMIITKSQRMRRGSSHSSES